MVHGHGVTSFFFLVQAVVHPSSVPDVQWIQGIQCAKFAFLFHFQVDKSSCSCAAWALNLSTMGILGIRNINKQHVPHPLGLHSTWRLRSLPRSFFPPGQWSEGYWMQPSSFTLHALHLQNLQREFHRVGYTHHVGLTCLSCHYPTHGYRLRGNLVVDRLNFGCI